MALLETTMSQTTTYTDTAVTNTAGHWIRMIICFCSFGFVYPNAFVEGMDLTAIQRSTEGDLYNK